MTRQFYEAMASSLEENARGYTERSLKEPNSEGTRALLTTASTILSIAIAIRAGLDASEGEGAIGVTVRTLS